MLKVVQDTLKAARDWEEAARDWEEANMAERSLEQPFGQRLAQGHLLQVDCGGGPYTM